MAFTTSRSFLFGVSLALFAPTFVSGTACAETWNDYSRMFSRSAGQFWASGTVAGQWAWSPQAGGSSDIAWGDPATWPPRYGEKFLLSADGAWVLIDGYSDGTGLPVRNVQRVNHESIGDANCENLRPIPNDRGLQHYAKWNIPTEGYCLFAEGTIQGPNPDGSTFTVHFAHRQRWSPPRPCSNASFSGRTCIAQREEWWDDNGSPFALRIDRVQQLARGLGPAFTIRQTFPTPWAADGRYFWDY